MYDDLNTPGYIASLHKLFEKAQKGDLQDKEIFSLAKEQGYLRENLNPEEKWLERNLSLEKKWLQENLDLEKKWLEENLSPKKK